MSDLVKDMQVPRLVNFCEDQTHTTWLHKPGAASALDCAHLCIQSPGQLDLTVLLMTHISSTLHRQLLQRVYNLHLRGMQSTVQQPC